MKKSVALIFALGLGVPAVAMAQNASPEMTIEHFDQLDVDNDGKVSKIEYLTFMDGAFKKLDVNGDGHLSPTETQGVLTAEQFSEIDENNDGKVSLDEFLAQVTRDFDRADTDEDGHLRYP